MTDTPLPAEEGGRPHCAYCGKSPSEMVLNADGSYTCFHTCPRLSVVPASVVSSEEGASDDAILHKQYCNQCRRYLAVVESPIIVYCSPACEAAWIAEHPVVGDASEGAWTAQDEAHLSHLAECRDPAWMGEVATRALAFIRSTRAALEEARRDSERLNWFDSYGMSIHPENAVDNAWNNDGFHDETEGWADDESQRWYPSIREAIDAAMGASPVQAPTENGPESAIPSQESEKV